jgi:CDP-diacylglycerol--glycerol-3-phosphate 3-phosphatidyltransferase/cardiolipin synthase
VLTLPNILTLSRIAALPLLIWLLWDPDQSLGYLFGFALYALMGITDYFDGYLARTRGMVSKLGTFLDPIADKIMVASVILMLCSRDLIAGVHVVAALIILMREIAVSGLREFLGGLRISMPVSWLAKWKTTLQFVALGLLILGVGMKYINLMDEAGSWTFMFGLIALWLAAGLTVVTGWDYLRIGLRHMD